MGDDTTPAGRGLRRWVRTHPRIAGGAVVLAVAAVAFVLVWFEPQALFVDDVVDEALPTAAPEPPASPASDPDDADVDAGPSPVDDPGTAGPVALVSGPFASRSRYTVTGTATAYALADGSRVLRLEEFESTNGPDLFVYLVPSDAAQDDASVGSDVVDLGPLRGNIGDQNYALPADTDLDRYDTVVIWCRRFTTAFGAAQLSR